MHLLLDWTKPHVQDAVRINLDGCMEILETNITNTTKTMGEVQMQGPIFLPNFLREWMIGFGSVTISMTMRMESK